MTKFGLEVLTGKALSVWLEFIDETGEKVFLLTSLALLYWADAFINKFKSKLNSFFTEWFQKQKEFITPFEEISPQ